MGKLSFPPLVCLLLALLFLFAPSSAGRVEFRDLMLESGKETAIRIGLWTQLDAPHGNKNTSLKLDLKITRNVAEEEANLPVVVFHADVANSIGFIDDYGMRHMCCNTALTQLTQCTGSEIIYLEKLNKDPTFTIIKAEFQKGQPVYDQSHEIDHINKSGIYYVYFVNCDGTNIGTVLLDGTKIYWMNPFGQLSGEQYYLMPFYGVQSLLYTAVGITWFVLTAIHWNKILPIQHCIAGVIALGMIESSTWYFEYLNYNMNGIYHFGAIIFGILVSTFKKTLSRLLVLVVSMGFGVVKANLGSTKYKVIFLGELYFIFYGALQILNGNAKAEGLTTMLIIPVALIDTFFYWWIFLSLARTISQLTIRKQPIKLWMYRMLFVVLVVSGLASAIVVILQLYIVMSSEQDELWKTYWMWDAFWHFLYFGILLAIAALWRPTTNNTRYAYVELRDGDYDEEQGTNMVQLNSVGTGDLSQRGTGKDEAPRTPRTPRRADKNDAVVDDDDIIPSFTLDEDEEALTESSKMN